MKGTEEWHREADPLPAAARSAGRATDLETSRNGLRRHTPKWIHCKWTELASLTKRATGRRSTRHHHAQCSRTFCRSVLDSQLKRPAAAKAEGVLTHTHLPEHKPGRMNESGGETDREFFWAQT